MNNDFRKIEMAFNRFMAWLFGVMTAIAIIGIFWNPAQFLVAGMSLILCIAFIREIEINKEPKIKK